MRVGIISDTHGLLRHQAIIALRGSDHILHAGDVGDVAILRQLRNLAPLSAIRGNVDSHGSCAKLPATKCIELAGQRLYMIHNLHDLDLNPAHAGIAAVISGHSHKAKCEWREGVLYFNPGSAGPRRFSLPVTLGFLTIDCRAIKATIVNIA